MQGAEWGTVTITQNISWFTEQVVWCCRDEDVVVAVWVKQASHLSRTRPYRSCVTVDVHRREKQPTSLYIYFLFRVSLVPQWLSLCRAPVFHLRNGDCRDTLYSYFRCMSQATVNPPPPHRATAVLFTSLVRGEIAGRSRDVHSRPLSGSGGPRGGAALILHTPCSYSRLTAD